MNTEEIRQKYLALHNALGSRKDAEDKDGFDKQHRKIWAKCDGELKARKEELRTKPIPSKAEQEELFELWLMFPDPILSGRDYGAEIDELRAEIKKLRGKKLKGSRKV